MKQLTSGQKASQTRGKIRESIAGTRAAMARGDNVKPRYCPECDQKITNAVMTKPPYCETCHQAKITIEDPLAPVLRLAAAYPTEREIRAALIVRMKVFCAATNQAPSVVSRTVMNDTTFFSRKIVGGGNFTLGSYQRFHDYFERNWPQQQGAKAQAASNKYPRLEGSA